MQDGEDPVARRELEQALERLRRVEAETEQPQRQVDPQHVINSYRQRTADLEFELYKRDALIAELNREVDALRNEIANLRVMHADKTEHETSQQGA